MKFLAFVAMAIVCGAFSIVHTISATRCLNGFLSQEQERGTAHNVDASASNSFDVNDTAHAAYRTIRNDVTSNYVSAAVREKVVNQFCTPDLKCPRETDYHPTCKDAAMKPVPHDEEFGQTPPLPFVQDPENFLQRLQEFFHGKHVALIGDSLTRQWFETLSCRMGLHLQFYEVSKTKSPERLRQASQQNIRLENAKSPRGKGTIYPYMRAFPEHFMPLDAHDPLPPLAESPNNNTQHDCKKLRTTLEYYKYDILDRSSDIFEFVATKGNADVIVFNTGIHYATGTTYFNDLRILMQQCANVNSMNAAESFPSSETINKTNSNLIKKKKLCLLRETFPRHWVPRDYTHNNSSKSIHKIKLETPFSKTLLRRTSCGPFLPGIYPIRFNPNSYVDDIAMTYNNLGIVRVESFARSAWKWHVKDDCTHFCHDDEFWDLVHESLMNTASEKLAEDFFLE